MTHIKSDITILNRSVWDYHLYNVLRSQNQEYPESNILLKTHKVCIDMISVRLDTGIIGKIAADKIAEIRRKTGKTIVVIQRKDTSIYDIYWIRENNHNNNDF